jgi:hypothetical protein
MSPSSELVGIDIAMLLALLACSDVQVSSTDEAPVIELLRPSGGSAFLPTEPLELCANIDDEAGLEALEITLASSVDGILEPSWGDCEGGNLGAQLQLSDADHLLTLSAVDPRGQAGVATTSVIATENTEPTCELLNPLDEDWIELGDSWLVEGLVSDLESGAASLEVRVESDLDGELWADAVPSSGELSFNWTPEASGDHLLTLSVADPRDLTAACQVAVYVDPCLDEDEDGFTTCEEDCDDLDPDSYPGGEEVADGADNDCDGDTDEGTVLGDDDEDGWTEAEGDCDDDDDSVHPEAEEIPYDGVDQDCDGGDADDLDSDGYTGGSDGSDCDDADADIHPGATETWYDGVDSDCDGANDYDQDADGHDSQDHGGDDCDDTDASISPSASELWYDGTDQDCDGASDYDQDADGDDCEDHGGDDCEDTDAAIHPGATDTWYDGVDADCDGASDYDQDADGYLSDSYGGSDCDDADADIHPGATDTWYDGVDSDCDGASDYDQDGDGYVSDGYSGDDCDDDDADINPGETETWYDGTDTDCDGGSDYDQDGDGDDAEDYGGGDCDDTDSAVHSGASETRDGKDNDCDDSCDEGLLSAGDLIVSEFMKDPSKVSDDYGEWFEVTNTTSTDIRLCEAWLFEDADGESMALSAGTQVLVPAGDYAVLGRSSNTSINGGASVDYAYATGFRLANGADEIVLVHDGSEIDRVEYDNGVDWPDPTGKSVSLDPSSLNASDNDDGTNWCSGSSSYGDGDKGTPGDANDGC